MQRLERLAVRFPFLYRPVVQLKAATYPALVRQEFTKDMHTEFESLKPYLPKEAKAILDIGCGVAGLEVFLSEHYNHEVDIYLLDKTAVDRRVYYRFEPRGSFYNDLSIARDILIANGTSASRIHLQEATADNKILFEAQFDVVISLMSWGFHYPVTTYLKAAHEKLKKGGVLLLDVRAGVGAEDEIKQLFGNCEVIYKTGKLVKVRATKN